MGSGRKSGEVLAGITYFSLGFKWDISLLFTCSYANQNHTLPLGVLYYIRLSRSAKLRSIPQVRISFYCLFVFLLWPDVLGQLRSSTFPLSRSQEFAADEQLLTCFNNAVHLTRLSFGSEIIGALKSQLCIERALFLEVRCSLCFFILCLRHYFIFKYRDMKMADHRRRYTKPPIQALEDSPIFLTAQPLAPTVEALASDRHIFLWLNSLIFLSLDRQSSCDRYCYIGAIRRRTIQRNPTGWLRTTRHS